MPFKTLQARLRRGLILALGAPGPAAAHASDRLDLNTATQGELEKLPDIGAVRAKRIILNRPYTSVEQLARAGIPAAVIQKIRPRVTASAATAMPPKIAALPAQTPPSPGMVWANPDTRVFHRAGDPWYGRTKKGQWMTEADALKAGYQLAKEGAVKRKKP
jgi:hypothetical protein